MSTVSRAERFDDEKRRIIGSCFAKKDADGSCKNGAPEDPITLTTDWTNLLLG